MYIVNRWNLQQVAMVCVCVLFLTLGIDSGALGIGS